MTDGKMKNGKEVYTVKGKSTAYLAEDTLGKRQ